MEPGEVKIYWFSFFIFAKASSSSSSLFFSFEGDLLLFSHLKGDLKHRHISLGPEGKMLGSK